jgi:hypothetical protein
MWTLLIITGLSWGAEGSLLLMGNSYTSYNNLAQLTQTLLDQQDPQWTAVNTAALTQGGYRWSQHEAALANSSSQHHGVFYGEDWAWVLLQEQSQIPGFPDGQTDREQSIEAGISLNNRIADHAAETVLYMTWGRRNGDASNPSLYPDFETMSDRIDAGYLGYAETMATEERPVWIAPAGRVFRRVYDRCVEEGEEPLSSQSAFSTLYTGDGSHPSARGSALIAATLYSTLSGRSASALDGPEGLETTTWEAITADVDHVIWGNTHGDIPFPWAYRWTDIANWTQGAHLGDTPMRPHLLVDSEADSSPSLSVSDAELELVPGGTLSLGTLTLADEARFSFTGGSLEGVTEVIGDINQTAGTLVSGPEPIIDGDYSLAEEGVLILPEELPLVITGDATLAGTLTLSAATGPGALLIEAGTLNTEGLVSAEPESYTFVLDGNTLRRDGSPNEESPEAAEAGCACGLNTVPLHLSTVSLLVVFLWRRRELSDSPFRLL